MGLLVWLTDVGGKLRIIHTVAAAGSQSQAAPKLKTRTVTLKELTAEIQAQQVRVLAELPAELSVAFDEVFEAAGLKAPPHGMTMPKLQELLASDTYKAMDRNTAQQAVLRHLSDQKASPEDLVKDAIARDQALDAFEEFARKKMQHRDQTRQEKLAELRHRIQDLQKQSADLAEDAKLDKERWRKWHDDKKAYEKQLAGAVSYLLDKPVVTIDQDDE